MSTEVAKTSSQLPASVPQGSWGAETTSVRDTLIPRVHLMQDLSKQVKARQATVGQLINSSTNEVIGDVAKPVEIIPIYAYVDWLIYQSDAKGKKKYLRTERLNYENEGWSYVDEEQGLIRERRLNFFATRPGRKDELPILISFRGMSTKAGRKLMTHFQSCQMKNIPPASQVFNLVSVQATKEDYTFFQYDVSPKRTTTNEELIEAFKWYQVISKQDVKVAEESDDEGAAF